MPKVILDAGHGGSDIGEYYERRSEKNDNLLLALRVGKFLMEHGVEVAYTRTADIYLPVADRVSIVNRIGAELLVSLHRLSGNSFNPTPSLDFFIKENDELGERVASSIGQNLHSSGYEQFSIIEQNDIVLISETEMPSIMVGIGYVRSKNDNLNYDNNFVWVAEGIAVGIYNILMSTEDKVSASDYHQPQYRYCIGVGPYHDYNRALECQLVLCSLGYETEIIRSWELYYIYIIDFDELDDAAVVEMKLRRSGYHSFIIRT